jgi:hypothetical protein
LTAAGGRGCFVPGNLFSPVVLEASPVVLEPSPVVLDPFLVVLEPFPVVLDPEKWPFFR